MSSFERRASHRDSRLWRPSSGRRRRRRDGIFQATSDNRLKAIDFAWNKDTAGWKLHKIVDTVNTADNILCVNATAQGTGFYQRIGRKITCHSLTIYGHLHAMVAAVDEVSQPDAISVRMLVVYDRQPRGALPNFNDIFASHSSEGDRVTESFSSPLDLTKTGRFRVLRDRTFSLKPDVQVQVAAARPSSFQVRTVREYIRLPSIETVYNGTPDNNEEPKIDHIETGAIYIILRSSFYEVGPGAGVNGGYATFLDGNIRLRYTDS